MFTTNFLAQGINAEVHNLTADTFKKFIADNENTLVKFYAPWCGHCKSMAPEYLEASNVIEGAKLAEVDVTVEAALGEEYGIKGFPTLKYFSKGNVIDYDGGRSKQDFVNYIEMMSSDAFTVIQSMEEARTMAEKNVVFVLKSKVDSPEHLAFSNISMVNRMMGKFVFIESDDTEIIIISNGTETPVTFSDEASLLQKMKVEKLPLFGKVSGENFASYMDTGLDLVWYAGSPEDYLKVKAEVEKSAKTFRGEFNFVFLDSTEFERQIEGMLGLTSSDLPRLVRTRDGPGKFILDETVTADNITTWMKNVTEGKVAAILKSEEVPESDDGPIKTLVGKNFDSVVTEDKDVVVMIHAPWCGHCKKMMPEFEAAAAEIAKKSPETVMAILDGTANELENANYPYTGFPTVYFKKAGSDKPIPFPFTGERNASSILEFLSKNVKTTFEFEVPVVVDDEL